MEHAKVYFGMNTRPLLTKLISLFSVIQVKNVEKAASYLLVEYIVSLSLRREKALKPHPATDHFPQVLVDIRHCIVSI